MSVNRWETHSATNAASVDDRRARQLAAHAPPPPPYASQQWSISNDVPSRHQSFPAQPQQHNGQQGRRPQDGEMRRQSQVPYSSAPYEQREMRMAPVVDRSQPNGYYDQVPYYEQGDMNRPPSRPWSSPSPQQQLHKQYNPPNAGGPPYANQPDPRLQPYIEPPRQNGYFPPPPPQQTYEEYRRQRPPQPGQEQPISYDIPHQQQAPPSSASNDSLPPPLQVRRGPAHVSIPVEIPDIPVRQNPLASSASADEEPPNIDEVLLGKRWSVHVISHLYQFQRLELGDYAHELVKFLRGHSIMTYEQEFGYSVVIRFTSECIAFQVIEARDLQAEFLMEKLDESQPPSNQQPELEKQESNDQDIRQRTGSFVVYFPKAAEDTNTVIRPANSHGPGRIDPKYVFLLRGNEELMAVVCSWVQRRFQCVVGLHVVRVTEESLRRVARNWVIEVLEREEKLEKARMRKAERLRKISATSGEDVDMNNQYIDGTPITTPPRAPLLLKYKAKADSDAVKAFTLTMPWASVRRVHALMNGGVGNALGTVPEVIERLEHLYFGNLQKDLAAMTLIGFQMEEVDVDTQGKVKFFKSTMVHSILQSFLDIFVVQQVAGPTDPIATF